MQIEYRHVNCMANTRLLARAKRKRLLFFLPLLFNATTLSKER